MQGANLGDEDDSVNGTTATATGFTGSWTPITTGAGAWNQLAQGVTFNAIGSVTYESLLVVQIMVQQEVCGRT